MFDIGFSELLLIAVVAIIVIGPKDLPVVVRHVAKLMRELRGAYSGIKKQMTQLVDESGINEMKHEMTTIIDLEGNPQMAYDVRELDGLRGVASRQSPVASEGRETLASPLAGEATRLNERSEFSRSGEGAMTGDSQTSAAPSPNPLPQGERASLAAPSAYKS